MNLIKAKPNYYVQFFILLILFGVVFETRAQKQIEYNYLSIENNKEVRPVDLNEEARKKCGKILRKQIGQSNLEVRYPAIYSGEAEIIADNLSNAIRKTQTILFPLPIENVKFYFFQRDIIPPSYRISEKIDSENFYLHLWIFKNREEINFDCSNKNGLCDGVYVTLPHELTHIALDSLLRVKNNRWFQEGLADYAGYKISAETPAKPGILKDIVPEISLHRKEIRESLFSWRYSSENDVQNEYFRYQAALQVIKLIVEEAEKKEIENPLQVLFVELIKQREVDKKPITAKGLIKIIQQRLKVDPKELGILSSARQKELVGNAAVILSQGKSSDLEQYAALYILAGIDEIPISDALSRYLLEKVYKDNKNVLFRNLAATALIRRAGQENFEALLNTFLKENPALENRSLEQVKKYLQTLSLRQH
jgi:hypothetical protein